MNIKLPKQPEMQHQGYDHSYRLCQQDRCALQDVHYSERVQLPTNINMNKFHQTK